MIQGALQLKTKGIKQPEHIRRKEDALADGDGPEIGEGPGNEK